ncbi:hypothetical protein [Streptomyces sp. NPDC055140]
MSVEPPPRRTPEVVSRPNLSMAAVQFAASASSCTSGSYGRLWGLDGQFGAGGQRRSFEAVTNAFQQCLLLGQGQRPALEVDDGPLRDDVVGKKVANRLRRKGVGVLQTKKLIIIASWHLGTPVP